MTLLCKDAPSPLHPQVNSEEAQVLAPLLFPPHCCHIGSDTSYLPTGELASPGAIIQNANLKITTLRRKE